jgi:hypothetical protein
MQPMSEAANSEPGCNPVEAEISDFDAAAYIFQISAEMASMADAHGFWRLAAALELARASAAEVVAQMSLLRQPRKPADDDAA